MKRTIFLTILCAWLLVPTGTPDDIITVWLIKTLGVELYLCALGIILLLMLHYKINIEKIKNVLKKVIA